MEIEFKDLTYTVGKWGKKDSKKTILKSLNGSFKPGKLSAILGPSGAGKSSLLNVLSALRTTGVAGTITINGEPRKNRIFHKYSCYITQEDLIQPLLNVKEIMMLAASLKLPSQTTKQQKHNIVSDILTNLGLSECVKTRTEYLSGGEKKRLSIALELINNPPVFFLDEPTSGLDNVASKVCLKLLRKLAREGRTIVCTIHQPSATLFQLFDHVYVVSQGYCVYQGTTHQLVPFLDATGLPCPTHFNPADFIIEMSDTEEKENVEIFSKAIANGKFSWSRTEIKKSLEKSTGENHEAAEEVFQSNYWSDDPTCDGTDTTRKFSCDGLGISDFTKVNELDHPDYATSFFSQFWTLLSRMILQISRNQIGLRIQLIHHLVCSIMLGIIYYKGADDGSQMFTHLKFCMSVILFHSYTWVIAPILVFPYEVKLLKKEHFNRWYRLTSYYMALTFSKMPSQILFSLLFLSIVYLMSGLPLEFYRFVLFAMVGIIVAVISEGLGLAIGAVFNVTNGCAIGPTLIAPFLGLAVYGFDFAQHIPWMMNLIMKMSYMRSGVEALVLTVFGFQRPILQCDDVYCHFRNPEIILQTVNIHHISLWSEVAVLLGLMVTFRIMLYVGLRWRLSR